ncbi:Intramembrane protease 2 [Madurella mycetomatis]|uniref:Intramembrane protease 2 n=1 Tax=Madurella mycetomatis TaxID=100816 RepID=A0A175W7T7_9PEZI|nr:Intramembrane protease 2 [Madurella mycetomatis]
MSSEEAVPDAAEAPLLSNPDSNQTIMPAFTWVRLLEPQFLLVIFSALGIIWLGAHGSLRRPPSAAPVKLKKGEKRREEEKFMEGLTLSDAIWFPMLLGVVLIGLYYLIQWLQDPAILNKLLRGYMSFMAIAGLATLAGDGLDILTSLVFPSMWADRDGQVHHIDPDRRCQYIINRQTNEETVIASRNTPFPGLLSNMAISRDSARFWWEVRHLLHERWTVRFAVHGTVLAEFKLRLNDLLRFAVGVGTALAYHLIGTPALSNAVSVAMCYASFMMLTPTSFLIGTMVLAGLFVYDIVMVFYTPYMITVAKNIDAPIKLVFNGSSGVSMLGLGDIVVPGMLMGLALRFDLFQYYQKQTKLEPITLTTEVTSHTSETTHKTEDTRYRRVKAPYVETRGQWGNRFWTTPLGSLFPVKEAASPIAATAFPKPYFYASVAGYAAGMVATLTALLVFNHGQPALLYLVPGVTGSLWLTGLIRGEVKDMWAYTEDGSLDTMDVVVEVDADGQVVKDSAKESGERVEARPKRARSGETDGSRDGEVGLVEGEVLRKTGEAQGSKPYELFAFSVTAPRSAA